MLLIHPYSTSYSVPPLFSDDPAPKPSLLAMATSSGAGSRGFHIILKLSLYEVIPAAAMARVS